MGATMTQDTDVFEEAARQVVDLANRLADQYPEADLWDIADGLLSGTTHYWLYSRQPCGDPRCEECAPINTAHEREAELLRLTRELSAQSEYYHAPTDANVGRA